MKNKTGNDFWTVDLPFPRFFQDQKLLAGGISHMATVTINSLIVQNVISKDICLFKGKYELNGDYSKDEALLITNGYKKCLPKFNENLEIFDSPQDSFMHHYPLGKKEQRKNDGIVTLSEKMTQKMTHKIRSLKGSSGASIVSKASGEIIAIHTGMADDAGITVNYLEGPQESKIPLPVVYNNDCEPITAHEINKIISDNFQIQSMEMADLTDYLGDFPKNNEW
jgi:hypothetical protein